jgi:hypothetical protein
LKLGHWWKYKSESEGKYTDFQAKNFDNIEEIVDIPGSGRSMKNWHNGAIKRVILNKCIDNNYNFTLLGLHILSMSKRIMNELFDIIERRDIPAYYQDMDGIHIAAEQLAELAEAHRSQYGRELIGSDLGNSTPTLRLWEAAQMFYTLREIYFS